MAEYSKIARGSFIAPEGIQVVNLPFQPQRVELVNVSTSESPTSFETTSAFWDVSMPQGTAIQRYVSSSTFPFDEAVDFVATGGISTFAAGLLLQYGPQQQIVSITAASPALITTSAPHGLSTGDTVILEGLKQSSTTGMQQIAGIPFFVTVDSPTAFEINWDASQSNYTALSGSPVGAFVRKVLYPWLYLPGVNFISFVDFGTTTTITTTTNHNYVLGQEIAFRIPPVYGTTQLNSLPNNLVPGSPIYAYITAITANDEFTCSFNSTGFTAFNTNQPFISYPGLQFPQVVAVGDVNSGGTPYSGGALYPSPSFPTFLGGTPTINGPAISGAFVNNTSQGFTVGLGSGASATIAEDSAPLLIDGDLYVWTATYYDLSL